MSRRSLRRVLTPLIGIAVIVILFGFVIPRFADYGTAWREVKRMRASALGWIAAAAVLNVLTYAPNWMVALPGLKYRQSLELTMAGTAIANVAPLGGAVSMGVQYRVMRHWGFSGRASSRAMVLTGVWNTLINFGLPVVGLAVLNLSGGRNAALQLTAQIGSVLFVVFVVCFVMVMAGDAQAKAIGRFCDRVANRFRRVFRKPMKFGIDGALSRFRQDSLQLVKQRWHLLTLTTAGGVLAVFLVLVAVLRGVGVPGSEVTLAEAFAAWSLTRLLSTIPITPGGLGIIDVGLAGALTAFGGSDGKVVATVLLYRILTFVPPIILGALAFVSFRRHGLTAGGQIDTADTDAPDKDAVDDPVAGSMG